MVLVLILPYRLNCFELLIASRAASFSVHVACNLVKLKLHVVQNMLSSPEDRLLQIEYQ